MIHPEAASHRAQEKGIGGMDPSVRSSGNGKYVVSPTNGVMGLLYASVSNVLSFSVPHPMSAVHYAPLGPTLFVGWNENANVASMCSRASVMPQPRVE